MMLRRIGRPLPACLANRLVQAAGFVFYLLAVQAVVTAGVGVYVYVSEGNGGDLLLPAISLLLAASYAAVGYFVRRHRLWARNFAFAFAAIGLLAFPLGTGLGFFVAVCLAEASRSRVFPALRRPAAAQEESPILRFEPELAAGQAG